MRGHLAKLRTADMVRYEAGGGKTQYWIKHAREIKGGPGALESAVRASTKLR